MSRAFAISGRRDLNSGPHRPERCALPGCATPRLSGPVFHTPAGRRWQRSGVVPSRQCPPRTADIVAFLDELLRDRPLRGLRARTASRSPAPRPSRPSSPASPRSASCSSARSRAGRAARARPPRPPVGLRAARASARRRRTRLRLLLANDVALAGYHLPLDAHPEHGNNALLARQPRRERPRARLPLQGRADRRDRAVRRRRASPPQELFDARRDRSPTATPLVFDAGPPHVRTLGIVSGAAADDALRRDRPRARRVPHRRAEGARDGAGARERHPLRRRRPLRDRDASASAGSASWSPSASACATSSSTSRTRSERRRASNAGGPRTHERTPDFAIPPLNLRESLRSVRARRYK